MKRTLLTLATVVFSVAAMGLSERPAAGYEFWVDQFNVEATGSSAGMDADYSTIVYAIGSAPQRPVAVGLNEVCKPSADRLEPAMTSFGYATSARNWVRLTTSSNVCGGAELGNVIFVVGANPAHSFIEHTQAGDPYHRLGICNSATTFLGQIAACVDHFTPASPHTAQVQANEALYTINVRYPGARRWMLGDFNLRPPSAGSANPVPAGWYSNSWEADPLERSTRDTGVKNDFIFGAKAHLPGQRSAVITAVANSDHHYFRGRFTA